MKITFDKIHTQKKQELLKQMMKDVNEEVSRIENKNQKLTECPICGKSEINDYVKAYNFNMSFCNNCKLIFCNPYPNDLQLNTYYNSKMKSFENEFFRNSFDNRVNLFKPRVALITKYKKKGKILDIGSAIGIFIEALNQSETNFDVTCCDMSQEACQELKSKYPQYEVINDNFLNISSENKYDVISMWDTLEHIVDQNLLLKKIHNLLKDDGIFIFSTPNTNSFEWNIAREKHVQILPPGHLNLMNEMNISILLENNSIQIIDTFTLNASLDISYVKKLIENNEVNNEYIGLYLKEKLFDEKFEKLLEKYLIDTKQAGNIVVIAKKIQESISKEFVFSSKNDKLKFIGDFDGLYTNDENPWGQDGTDERMGEYYRYSRNNILKNLQQYNQKNTLLEIGCGLGYVVEFFNKNSTFICDGADISHIAINKASVLFQNYNFFCLDIQNENIIINKRYDIIVLNQVLWYVLENLEHLFNNVFNLLSENGVFVISNAFMEKQNYGQDIINGFEGLMQYITNNQYDKFKITNSQLFKDSNLLYKDGCIVMEKINE